MGGRREGKLWLVFNIDRGRKRERRLGENKGVSRSISWRMAESSVPAQGRGRSAWGPWHCYGLEGEERLLPHSEQIPGVP